MAKNKGGRPSAYKEEYKKQAYKLSLLGLTDKQMADVFGVSEATFNNWKESKEGFLESLKEGKEVADAEVSQSLYKRAKGYDYIEEKQEVEQGVVTKEIITTKHVPADTTSMIFWLKNRQPQLWRDKQELEHSAGQETAEAIKGFLDDKAN